MSYLDLVKERLHISINEEEGETNRAIRARGGEYLTDDAEALINGLEKTVLLVLNKLREDSMSLPPSAFSELWNAVRVHFKEQIPLHARRRKLTLKSRYEQRGRYGPSEDMAIGQLFDQRISNLLNDIHHRIEESVKSYNLLALPSRQTTKDLLALIEEVSVLLKSQGDVGEFIRGNTSRLERIETEVKRQGLDIAFAADALTKSMGDKLTKNAVSQFIGGMAPNAGWDGIKLALSALLPFLPS